MISTIEALAGARRLKPSVGVWLCALLFAFGIETVMAAKEDVRPGMAPGDSQWLGNVGPAEVGLVKEASRASWLVLPEGVRLPAPSLAQTEPYVPESADELFGLPAEPGEDEQTEAEDLFGLGEGPETSGLNWGGFYQFGLAYTYAEPSHWSKIRNTLEIGLWGGEGNFKWRATGRVVYDAVYALTNFYPTAVRDDQEFEATVRETYADISMGNFDFRLGRQQIIWGEVVGFFLADVVSAKDFRGFIVEDFDLIRIPQWAARAEYFGGEVLGGDFSAEALWIPFQTVDDIGKPGAEFYPFRPLVPPGINTFILAEQTPADTLSNSGGGVRASYLKAGWDTALFYYTSIDARGAFQRAIVPRPSAAMPTFLYQRNFDSRIHQIGATATKDLGPAVFKFESVYTMDRRFETASLTDIDGLVTQDVFDYLLGIEWYLPKQTQANVQFFQSWIPDRAPGIVPDGLTSGFSIFLSTEALHPKVTPELLWIRTLNRDDWELRARVNWEVQPNLNVATGVDVFDGPALGFFGRFNNRDRVYTELRYSF